MQKKITIFIKDLPYPPIHGAKIDIWHRLVFMHTLGYHLQIVCWTWETPSAEHKEKIEEICDQFIIIPQYQSVYKKCQMLLYSFLFPLYPASISIYTDYHALKKNLKNFNPDILWLETYAPGLTALKVTHDLSLPLFYRSHNVEHHYAQAITDSVSDKNLKEKIVRFMSTLHLEYFEKKLIQKSHIVFDISTNDLKFWKNLYPRKQIIWLPPLAEGNHSEVLSNTEIKNIDFLFVGNLFTKNNILALQWMINEVIPLVHKKLPHTLLYVAGSNPSSEFLAYLQSFPYVQISFNIEQVEPLLRKAKVIVNPALKGSGITIKTIDGLRSKRIWVGTKQAFQGLPDEFYEILCPANTAQELAEQMIYFYNYPDRYPYTEVSVLCKHYFDTLPKQILSELFSHLS